MAADDTPPEEHAELAWLSWRVHAALEKLPERVAVVLELAILERPVTGRDRELPGRSAGDREDTHARGLGTPGVAARGGAA